MTAYPPAARRLIAQVTQHRPEAEVRPAGDADGYGVTRSVVFDAKTSKWLVPVLEACDDERIAEVSQDGKKAVVTFVPGIAADYGHSFDIDEADAALSQGQ